MSDEKLIRAIRNRSETAITQVIETYSKLLFSIAQSVLKGIGSTQDAEECVADTFISLWQSPDKFDPARGSLKTWLSIVTRTKALDRCRALARRDTLPLDEAAFVQIPELPEDKLLREDARQSLQETIARLDEPDREILLRRYCRDQKPREIALALGIPVKQVENRLYRTKKKLREILSSRRPL